MTDPEAHKKLTAAMARLVALRQDAQKKRRDLQEHAAGMVDVAVHRAKVGSDHLEKHDNVLVHRYVRTHLTEAARLRAASLRSEKTRALRDADGE